MSSVTSRHEHLESKLRGAVRKCERAAKQAKTNECQRTIKAVKKGRPKDGVGPELLAALKNVDYRMVAQRALHRRLHRLASKRFLLPQALHLISNSSEIFPSHDIRGQPEDSAAHRIESNKDFSHVLQQEYESLRALLTDQNKSSIDGVGTPQVKKPSRTSRKASPQSSPESVRRSSDAQSRSPTPDSLSQRSLPALATGFTLGDEATSDDGAIFDDNDESAPRRNRRGQRARRALWEKRYGKRANHLVAASSRSTPSRSKPMKSAPAPRHDARPLPERDSRLTSIEQNRPVHQSWLAKQRERQLADASSGSKGRKIVFDL